MRRAVHPKGVCTSAIRELRDGDLPALAALVRELVPTQVISPHLLDHTRKSTRWWVVDRGDAVVAAARTGRFGRSWVGVTAGEQRHGLGSELLALVEQGAREGGADEVVGWTDGGVGARFAEKHGYEEGRRKPVSALQLNGELPAPEPPPGVELVPLVELGERLHELYELSMITYAGDPGGGRDGEQTFEEWLRDDLGVPELTYHGSTVATVDGRLAALSLVTTDGVDRAENEFTATHPDYRGRGLATLVKLAALRWCQQAGVREVWTGNDSENAAMLAVNRKLGYRPSHVRVMHVKSITT